VWYPDNLVNLGRQYLLVSDLDAWFFKDPYMVRIFRDKLALKAFYLPEACNSLWHRRVELSAADHRKYDCDLGTVSNMYYYRAKSLENFLNHDMKIWGKSYPSWLSSPLRPVYQDEYVAGKEKAKALNAAKIVLNTMHYGEIEGVNCRLFEAAGCGAFQIADWKPALPDLFEPEKEIVTFRTQKDLKEKVDYYLAHPKQRREIADRAYARAHREHTYEVRIRKMLDALGFSYQAARSPRNGIATEVVAQQIT
jgi:spore maturation protein CgeB